MRRGDENWLVLSRILPGDHQYPFPAPSFENIEIKNRGVFLILAASGYSNHTGLYPEPYPKLI